MDVQFTDDIPRIERQGQSRSSKYDDLLAACVENAGKAAKITVDKQGAASSRATSIKNAAASHEAEQNDDGVFIVATRSGESEDEFHIYTMFAEKGTEEYDEEIDARQRRAEAARKRQKTKASNEEESSPKPKKKVKRKAA